MRYYYWPTLPNQEPEPERPQLQIPLMHPDWYQRRYEIEQRQKPDNSYEIDYTVEDEKEESSHVIILEI